MSTCNHQLVAGILSSLAASRRRFILAYLLDTEGGQVSVDALVEYLIEEDPHSPSPDREAVAVSLYHRHLPMLADEGLIEYDNERGTIATTAEAGLVAPYLEVVQRGWTEREAHGRTEGR